MSQTHEDKELLSVKHKLDDLEEVITKNGFSSKEDEKKLIDELQEYKTMYHRSELTAKIIFWFVNILIISFTAFFILSALEVLVLNKLSIYEKSVFSVLYEIIFGAGGLFATTGIGMKLFLDKKMSETSHQIEKSVRNAHKLKLS